MSEEEVGNAAVGVTRLMNAISAQEISAGVPESLTPAISERSIARRIEQSGRIGVCLRSIVVAEVGGNIVGTLGLEKVFFSNGGEAAPVWLSGFSVCETQRSRGIGTLMLGYAMDELRGNGLSILMVARNNLRAVGYYESLEYQENRVPEPFRPEGPRRNYYVALGAPVNEIRERLARRMGQEKRIS